MTEEKIVCCGGGVIGASWAFYFALKGHGVTVYDISDEALERARSSVEHCIESMKGFDVIDDAAGAEIRERIAYTTDPEAAFTGATLIQENVPEKLDIKQSTLELIERYAPDDCLYASSTSGMPITNIAAKAAHPERCIGSHPFNPPHLMPLVEITKGEKTEQQYVDRAVAFYHSIGKEPVVLQKEKIGFIANRLQHVILRESMSLVAEGVCTVPEIDRALIYGVGLRWASVGAVMTGELGSANGIRESNEKFHKLNESIFQDIENRQLVPENWGEVAEKGVADEFASNPDFMGHNRQEVASFRDNVLVELLKLHHKL